MVDRSIAPTPQDLPQVEVLLDWAETLTTAVDIERSEWDQWFLTWGQQLAVSGSPLHRYEVTLKLTDDPTIAELNAAYRQQPNPTDVLAFAALEDDFPQVDDLLLSDPLYLGDIVVSLETAQRQAAAVGHPLRWEVAWLAAHGFLHLLGWDHPDEAHLAAMMTKQTDLLTTSGLSPI